MKHDTVIELLLQVREIPRFLQLIERDSEPVHVHNSLEKETSPCRFSSCHIRQPFTFLFNGKLSLFTIAGCAVLIHQRIISEPRLSASEGRSFWQEHCSFDMQSIRHSDEFHVGSKRKISPMKNYSTSVLNDAVTVIFCLNDREAIVFAPLARQLIRSELIELIFSVFLVGSFPCLLVVLHLKRLFGYYLGEHSFLFWWISKRSDCFFSSSLYSIDAHCDPLVRFLLDRS